MLELQKKKKKSWHYMKIGVLEQDRACGLQLIYLFKFILKFIFLLYLLV